MEDKTKISEFEQLKVWQEAQSWAVQVYKITSKFPSNEIYGVTSQIRRAVSSISANIAEGFGRRTSPDKLHFYSIAYGSILETKNFLYLVEKLGYLQSSDLETLINQGTVVQKLRNAFMRPLK